MIIGGKQGQLAHIIVILTTIECFKYLAVAGHTSANYAKYGKNGNQNSSSAQPQIQVMADEETKSYAPDHCQPQLHYNLKMGSPSFVTFEVEDHFALS
jgi:hypothetical protein